MSNAPQEGNQVQYGPRGSIEAGAVRGLLGDWRHVGTVPFEAAYGVNFTDEADAADITAVAAVTGLSVCVPFLVQRTGVIDNLYFQTTVPAGAGGVMQLAVYDATSRTNLYPGQRIAELGPIAVDVPAGVFTVPLPEIGVDPGRLLWFAVDFDVAAPTILLLAAVAGRPIMGFGLGGLTTHRNTLILVHGLGPFGDPYPAGALPSATACVALYVRFSA